MRGTGPSSATPTPRARSTGPIGPVRSSQSRAESTAGRSAVATTTTPDGHHAGEHRGAGPRAGPPSLQGPASRSVGGSEVRHSRKTTSRSITKLTAVPKPCEIAQASVSCQLLSGSTARASSFTPRITKNVVP